MKNAIKIINEIRAGDNPDLRFLRLLGNKIDRRTNIGKSVIANLYAAFTPEQVFRASIPINAQLKEAEARRETIFRHTALPQAPERSGTWQRRSLKSLKTNME